MGWWQRRRERRRWERRLRDEKEARERELRERRAAFLAKERRRIQLQWRHGVRDRSIQVILKPKGMVFIDVHSDTLNGFSITDGPPLTLPSLDDADVLGATVLEALSRSNRQFLPARNMRTDPPGGEVLEMRKAKSWSEYLRHARYVRIYASCADIPTVVAFQPYHNMGRSRGQAISEAKFTIAYESPEQLGRAVQAAMAKATTV